MEATDTLISESKAAEYLGISERTLQRYRKHGTAPPYIQLETGTLRYSLGALQKWLADRTVSPKVEGGEA